jgi:hypothetical protein
VTSVSIWTAGYVIGQLPIMLLLTRVSPRWIVCVARSTRTPAGSDARG